uniref:Uncharacterized protein n=1 Tax=Opuntia streptacantha TaxID=393608 RepID=A0A7C9CXM2_OPUST
MHIFWEHDYLGFHSSLLQCPRILQSIAVWNTEILSSHKKQSWSSDLVNVCNGRLVVKDIQVFLRGRICEVCFSFGSKCLHKTPIGNITCTRHQCKVANRVPGCCSMKLLRSLANEVGGQEATMRTTKYGNLTRISQFHINCTVYCCKHISNILTSSFSGKRLQCFFSKSKRTSIIYNQ